MSTFKIFFTCLIVFKITSNGFSQDNNFEKNHIFLNKNSKIDSNLTKYFEFLLPFYPELKGANLHIQNKNQRIPFTTIPSIFNIVRPRKSRKYFINVSTESNSFLDAIILKNLGDSAKYGVFAHELAHVSDFHTQGFGYTIKVLFKHLDRKKLDEFEFETDHIVIKHGLGKYLLAWSTDTHTKLHKADFDRNTNKIVKNERYMSPETIKKYLLKYPNSY